MSQKPTELVIETDSAAETEQAGETIGRALENGETIALEGDLGAGKTTFVRGIARGLGIPDKAVSSPTFVFAHEHQGRHPLAHLDLFRTGSETDLADLGAFDYLDGRWVVAIEWADRAAGFLPENRLAVQIRDVGTDRRRLILRSLNPAHAPLFALLGERFCAPKNSTKS